MALNRRTVRVAAGLLVFLAGVPALGQNLMDGQIFAPADLSPYGSGIQPSEGYFFRFDGLHWAISKPTATTIEGLTRLVFYGPFSGDPTNPPAGPQPGVLQQDSFIQTNTLDTGAFRSTFTDGNRTEFGRVCDRRGWIFGIYRLNDQTQQIVASDVDMVFFDPAFGPQGAKLLEGVVGQIPDPADPDATIDIIRDLPLKFDDVILENRVEHWSTELMYIHRTRPFHRGGTVEFFAGVRYMEFDDTFIVDARGEGEVAAGDDDDDGGQQQAAQVPAILADSIWSTEAENHIVGPQLGARYFKIWSRLMLNVEGRYMAGYNFQSLRQRGTLGTDLDPPGGPVGDDDDDDGGGLFEPRLMGPTSFNHAAHFEEYSSVVELRAEARYKLTRAIDVGAGWTGMWIDNVARASNVINYEVPDMGLRTLFNRQNAFVHGVSFTVTVNR